MNSFSLNALSNQILSASLRIGKKDITGMIDEPSVHFFRDTIIVAAIAGLHVINGNPHPFGYDGNKAAVCVGNSVGKMSATWSPISNGDRDEPWTGVRCYMGWLRCASEGVSC